MILPNVAAEEWADKLGIEIANYRCPKCGRFFKTDVPVLMIDYAGLQSPIHECGPSYAKAVLVPRSENAKSLWDGVV